MIEQTATVVAIEGDRATVEAASETACQSCAVKKGCGTSVLSGVVGNKVMRFELDNTVGARQGDRVVLGLPEHAVVTGSLLVYLLPLAVLILSALITDASIDINDTSRDTKVAAIALLSMLATVFATRRLFASRDTARAYTPVMLRIEPGIRSAD